VGAREVHGLEVAGSIPAGAIFDPRRFGVENIDQGRLLDLLGDTDLERRDRVAREYEGAPAAAVLSVEEMRAAYAKGLARHDAARARSGEHRYGFKGINRPEADGESAVAEAMVARMLGRRWLSDGVVPDRPEDGDVEGGISVRHTLHPTGRLVVHLPVEVEDDGSERVGDLPDQVGVLVVGAAPDQRVVGWMLHEHAQDVRFWWADAPKRPAFFVPQDELRNMGSLNAFLESLCR
jgi:hypothetical protein